MLSVDGLLDVDKVISLRPPLREDTALAEAERLYATHTSPDGATLVRYRVKEKYQEPQELVYGKVENVSVIELEEVPNG